MRKIITEDSVRVETGELKINDDWSGLFIRGDDCMELEHILGKVLRGEGLTTFELKVIAKYYFEINGRVCARF